MAPGREQGEVQVSDRSETGGDHEKVPGVAAEREGEAGGSLEKHKLPADEGKGIPGSGVGNGSEDVG